MTRKELELAVVTAQREFDRLMNELSNARAKLRSAEKAIRAFVRKQEGPIKTKDRND